jgi:hypothetical protein
MGTENEVGKVYVVHNDCIQLPNSGDSDGVGMLYKVGRTRNKVSDRYYGLDLKMPGKFICDFAYEFGDGKYKRVENALHDTLSRLRENGEWFHLDDKTLDGIQETCDLMGGTLVAEEEEVVDESEVRKTTVVENPYFKKLLARWKETTKMKTYYCRGGRNRWGHLCMIRFGEFEVGRGIWYSFWVNNDDEKLYILLLCQSREHPGLLESLRKINGLNIKGYTFAVEKFGGKPGERGCGWLCSTEDFPLTMPVDDVIEVMTLFIEATKDTVIEVCKADSNREDDDED